jgi:hypothetical protein
MKKDVAILNYQDALTPHLQHQGMNNPTCEQGSQAHSKFDKAGVFLFQAPSSKSRADLWNIFYATSLALLTGLPTKRFEILRYQENDRWTGARGVRVERGRR